jgi:hypothetical protein
VQNLFKEISLGVPNARHFELFLLLLPKLNILRKW